MPFQIHALPAEQFTTYFDLDDAALRHRRALRRIATKASGFPCRVSLADAEEGETLVLLNYVHLPQDSPYQAAHAIYVRQGAVQAKPNVGEVPAALGRRLISVRLYDNDHIMLDAEVVAGEQLAATLTDRFDDMTIAYVHLHIAGPGCFMASAMRV